MKCDTLFFNGKFQSMEIEGEEFSAIAQSKGKIVEVFKTLDPNSVNAKKKIDMKGQTILPGFIDCHTHFIQAALMSQCGFNISYVKGDELYPQTVSEALAIIRENLAKDKSKSPKFAFNYVASSMAEQRLPTFEELDSVCCDRPFIVYNIDGHSASCNTLALSVLGLVSQNGILSGAEFDHHQGKVLSLVEKSANAKVLYKGIAHMVNHAVSLGITSVCVLEGNDDAEKDIFLTVAKTFLRNLPIDISLFLQYFDVDKAKPHFGMLKNRRLGGCGVWELDGSVGSHTAAFNSRYQDKNTKGSLYKTDEQLQAKVKKADSDSVQISAHAIGTAAIRQITDTLALVVEEGNPLRHRIDHFEFPDEVSIQKVIEKKICITVQPGYSWLDKRFMKSYDRFLKPEIIQTQLPLKRLYDGGVKICGSSDCPVQDINPFMQMNGMTDFAIEKERLSNFEAFSTYTRLPAYVTHAEKSRGTLAVGKQCDLVCFDQDVMSTDDLKNLLPTAVYVNGKKFKKMKGGLANFVLSLLHKKKLI